MKKILITGSNSYIGTSFEKYLAQWPEQYQVDTVDMIDGTWWEKNFGGYLCVRRLNDLKSYMVSEGTNDARVSFSTTAEKKNTIFFTSGTICATQSEHIQQHRVGRLVSHSAIFSISEIGGIGQTIQKLIIHLFSPFTRLMPFFYLTIYISYIIFLLTLDVYLVD